MQVLLKLAEKRPNLILDQFYKIKSAALENPNTITLAAQILSAAGRVNKVIKLCTSLSHINMDASACLY